MSSTRAAGLLSGQLLQVPVDQRAQREQQLAHQRVELIAQLVRQGAPHHVDEREERPTGRGPPPSRGGAPRLGGRPGVPVHLVPLGRGGPGTAGGRSEVSSAGTRSSLSLEQNLQRAALEARRARPVGRHRGRQDDSPLLARPPARSPRGRSSSGGCRAFSANGIGSRSVAEPLSATSSCDSSSCSTAPASSSLEQLVAQAVEHLGPDHLLVEERRLRIGTGEKAERTSSMCSCCTSRQAAK